MFKYRIIFSELALDAFVGILEHEYFSSQKLLINAEFDIEIPRPKSGHTIESVLDYRNLREAIVRECTRAHTDLLETLAERIKTNLLERFREIRFLSLRISKPQAFFDCGSVSVEVQAHRHVASTT